MVYLVSRDKGKGGCGSGDILGFFLFNVGGRWWDRGREGGSLRLKSSVLLLYVFFK